MRRNAKPKASKGKRPGNQPMRAQAATGRKPKRAGASAVKHRDGKVVSTWTQHVADLVWTNGTNVLLGDCLIGAGAGSISDLDLYQFFDKYRPSSLNVRFESEAGSTVSGRVAVAFIPDPLARAPTSVDDVLYYRASKSRLLSSDGQDELKFKVPNDLLEAPLRAGHWWTSAPSESRALDRCFAGRLAWAVEGVTQLALETPSVYVNLGKLYVDYSFEYVDRVPRPMPAIGATAHCSGLPHTTYDAPDIMQAVQAFTSGENDSNPSAYGSVVASAVSTIANHSKSHPSTASWIHSLKKVEIGDVLNAFSYAMPLVLGFFGGAARRSGTSSANEYVVGSNYTWLHVEGLANNTVATLNGSVQVRVYVIEADDETATPHIVATTQRTRSILIGTTSNMTFRDSFYLGSDPNSSSRSVHTGTTFLGPTPSQIYTRTNRSLQTYGIQPRDRIVIDLDYQHPYVFGVDTLDQFDYTFTNRYSDPASGVHHSP